MKSIFLILLATTAYADCNLAQVLKRIRPGTEWYSDGGKYENLVWVSTTTTKPTRTAYMTAKQACEEDQVIRAAEVDKARAIIKDTTRSDSDRLKALILLLDLDK